MASINLFDVLKRMSFNEDKEDITDQFAQTALQKRFQPNMQDAATGIFNTNQAFAQPELYGKQPLNAQMASQERMKSELAPLAMELDLQNAGQDLMTKQMTLPLDMQLKRAQAANYERMARGISLSGGSGGGIDLETLMNPEEPRPNLGGITAPGSAPVPDPISGELGTPDNEYDLLVAQRDQYTDMYNQLLMRGAPAKQTNQVKGAISILDKRIGEIDKGADALAGDFEKTGLAGLAGEISKLKTKVDSYGDNNLPAVGGLEALTPGIFLDQDGTDMRALVSEVHNAILKARSGGAVTPQESDRLLRELGTGPWSGDKNFKAGLKNTVDALNERINNATAGANPAALRAYQKRGGTVKPIQTNGTAGVPAGLSPEEEAELQALRKRFGR